MFALLLAACTPALPTKAPEPTDTGCDAVWYRDTDGDGVGDASRGSAAGCEPPDGYVAADGDCDDFDATLFPGAVEVCDDVDQDCDGAFDEDAADADTWHADTDGDGFGAADEGLRACERPGTHVLDATDCDDTDAAAFPGADERCNDADDDCDGTIDEDPVATPTWYADTDGDGWGGAPTTDIACDAPAGTAATDGDCDDADPLVFPDAAEACDGLDADCDGVVDEDAADAPTWFADADGDGFGDAGDALASCGAPAGYVADATDCDDTDATVFPGAVERCGGADEDCDGAIDEDGAGPTAWYADADADGYGDLSDTLTACLAPAAYVADASDCDDTDAAVNPAGVEVCNTTDDDCDGDVDEGGAAPDTWYADGDADGYGDPGAATAACTLPAGHVADASDCDDADAAVNPAAAEVCNGADDDCDGVTDTDATDRTTFYADADSDGFGDAADTVLACDAPTGFVADATDCDDTTAGTNPAAVEVCNGTDDDCDGVTDTDATDPATWYADADADGYGDAAVAVLDCTVPAGFVGDGTDCDDADATVNPGALEWCGGGDEDCDGVVDEDDAADATTWYRDADVDGRGDPDTTVTTCVRPYGYLADATDCDDADGAVHPGMSESCATPYDDDCDGSITTIGASDCTDWYADADADGYGDPDLSQCQCTAADGYTVENDDDCDDADADAYPYAPETWGDGVDQSCDGNGDAADLADEAVLLTAPAAGETAGFAVTGGDLDADGYPDLVIGAPSASSWAANAGAVYVVFGAPEADASLADADLIVYGSGAGYRAGSSVGVGDADGDGLGDLVLGAPRAGVGGAAYLFLAPSAGTTTTSAAPVSVVSTDLRDDLGGYVGLDGDLDGDGADELVLGAPDASTGIGALYLYSLPAGALGTVDATVALTGTAVGDELGLTAARVGDLDGDGLDDLAVGAPGAESGGVSVGVVYLLYGMPVSGDIASMADHRIAGATASFEAGTAIAAGGDIDGDGLPDLLVGAPGPTWGAGEVYLLTSPFPTSVASARTTITSNYGSDLGEAIAGAGDIDGDGAPDLAVSEPYNARSGALGAVHILFDVPAGTLTLDDADATLEGTLASNTGNAVHLLGDADGDGLADLLVGAWHDDTAGADAGGAWFVAGR